MIAALRGLTLAAPSSLLGFFLLRVFVVAPLQEAGAISVGFGRLWMLHALTLLVPLVGLTAWYARAENGRAALRRSAVTLVAEWVLVASYLAFAYVFLSHPREVLLPGLGTVQRESAVYLLASILGSLTLAVLSALFAVVLGRRVKEAT